MFKLRYLNVERIVESEYDRDRLIKEGYKLVVEEKEDSSREVSNELDSLTVEQLKEIATSKGIEFNSKIKKNELIEMIEERE